MTCHSHYGALLDNSVWKKWGTMVEISSWEKCVEVKITPFFGNRLTVLVDQTRLIKEEK